MGKLKVNPFEFDSRMVEWNLKHGLITKDQLNTYKESLADESSNVEEVKIEDETTNGAAGEATFEEYPTHN